MFFQKQAVRGRAPLRRPRPPSDPDPSSPPRSGKAEKAAKEVKEAHSRIGTRTTAPTGGPFTPRAAGRLRSAVGNGDASARGAGKRACEADTVVNAPARTRVALSAAKRSAPRLFAGRARASGLSRPGDHLPPEPARPVRCSEDPTLDGARPSRRGAARPPFPGRSSTDPSLRGTGSAFQQGS